MDMDEFLAARQASMVECQRLDDLVKKYKKQIPNITACWDKSIRSIDANDIDSKILSGGMAIFDCDMKTLWSGLYQPSIYEGSTIWDDVHNSSNIAKVIENWGKNVPLSPIFLIPHPIFQNGLVADGKHRLTVSRAISATDTPFMVSFKDVAWAKECFPGASIICTKDPQE
jgi:hypothetical protein